MREFLCQECISENPTKPFLTAQSVDQSLAHLKSLIQRHKVEEGRLMLEKWENFL